MGRRRRLGRPAKLRLSLGELVLGVQCGHRRPLRQRALRSRLDRRFRRTTVVAGALGLGPHRAGRSPVASDQGRGAGQGFAIRGRRGRRGGPGIGCCQLLGRRLFRRRDRDGRLRCRAHRRPNRSASGAGLLGLSVRKLGTRHGDRFGGRRAGCRLRRSPFRGGSGRPTFGRSHDRRRDLLRLWSLERRLVAGDRRLDGDAWIGGGRAGRRGSGDGRDRGRSGTRRRSRGPFGLRRGGGRSGNARGRVFDGGRRGPDLGRSCDGGGGALRGRRHGRRRRRRHDGSLRRWRCR